MSAWVTSGNTHDEQCALVDRLAAALDFFQELEIVPDVGIAGIPLERGLERAARAPVVAAQHVGEALVVHDLGRLADDG